MNATDAPFAVEAIGIHKRFGGVSVLRGCDLRVRRGEIHALLGQNGAGKSTLIKIINGVYPSGSFEGRLNLGGADTRLHAPAEARRHGIAYVPQEIDIVEGLSVAENIFAGGFGGRFGIVDYKTLNRRARVLLGQLGLTCEPTAPMTMLSTAERHLVMIARALAGEAVVLVLDEPTASLSAPEIDRLLNVLSRLRELGTSIIYVTHRLPEVLAICDRASVLRDGAIAAEFERAYFDIPAFVRAMAGREIGALFGEHRAPAAGEPILRTEKLTVTINGVKRVHDVSFELGQGEILGIAGLLGAGRSELLAALYGNASYQGKIVVDGNARDFRSPSDARKAGIALLTEDRKRAGLLFNMSVGANISIGDLSEVSNAGVLSAGRERKTANALMQRFFVKSDIDAPIGHLSGGNQQKTLIARALLAKPSILLLDDPSKGVDIATRQEIYRLIVQLADAGCALIITASDLEEVIGLADRCLVMTEGRIVDEFKRGDGDEARALRAIVAARGNAQVAKPIGTVRES